MKTLLIMPPQWDLFSPSLALPCLTAALQKAGFEVIQKDINIEFHDLIFSKVEIERAYQNFCARRSSLEFLGAIPKEIDNIIARKDFLMNEIENAKEILRSPQYFYDYQKLIASIKLLEEAYQFISLGYFRTYLSFYTYSTIYSFESTDQILNAVKDEFCNPYIDFYTRRSIPEIKSMAPQVIGISISVTSQVIPGFTLAYMIKQALPDVHLVLGGSHFSNFKDTLRENRQLFSIFDSVVIDEGETALVELVTSLAQGTSLRKVPNLIYRDGSQIICNDIFHIENLNELPTPVYDGLPFHLYLAPDLLFPIYASRGCYWSKCAFCKYDPYIGENYRKRNIEKVIDDIKLLKQRYGAKIFGFVDAALSFDLLGKISNEFIRNELQIDWACFSRFEKQIDKELCEQLVKSGCRIIIFGLESACDRILFLMEKGIKIDVVKQVLRETSQAGIANFLTGFCGFPTETPYEAKETLQFILDNYLYIAQASVHFYVLLRNSKVYLYPKNYRIKELVHQESRDLVIYSKYQLEQGLSQKEAMKIVDTFHEIQKELELNFLDLDFLFNLYTFHYKTDNLIDLFIPKVGKYLRKKSKKEQRLKKATRKFKRINI